MTPPEDETENSGANVAKPSQGNVSPETDFFCQLTDCHGISREQALAYIAVLKAWFGDLLDGYAKQEELNNLRARVKEIENNFARKSDIEKTVREVLLFWGGIVMAIFAFAGGGIWFFWEKIHPWLTK